MTNKEFLIVMTQFCDSRMEQLQDVLKTTRKGTKLWIEHKARWDEVVRLKAYLNNLREAQ